MRFIISKLLMALLVVAVFAASIGMIGLSSGASTGSDVLINTSLNVSSNTSTIWVDVTGNQTINSADNHTRATIELTADGMLLSSRTLNVSENETKSWEYSVSDSEARNYDSWEILVTGESNHSSADYGTLSTMSGSSMTFTDSWPNWWPIAGLVALAGIWMVISDD